VTLKHLLVHLDASPRSEERLTLSVSLARRFGARLTGLFSESGSLGPGIVGQRDPAAVAADLAAARAAFETRTAEARLQTDWWAIEGGDYAHVVGWTVVCCRYADLAIFGQRTDDGARVPADLIEQALEDSGRPLLVVPSAGHYRDVGKRVLVAWTGGRESARAVNDALPLLAGSAEVSVLSIQRPSSGDAAAVPPVDIVAHLAAHGITASYERLILDEMDVANHVLNRAADWGADLTVVGAHGQRGFPYLPRSSMTDDILRTMTTPVLLSR
jgi:nucleotide-binding universal stress UspA family protein